eukprot:2530004-Lingulodinium_polyedra.AAC.1
MPSAQPHQTGRRVRAGPAGPCLWPAGAGAAACRAPRRARRAEVHQPQLARPDPVGDHALHLGREDVV